MILADREPKIAARVPTSISVPLALKKMAKPLATVLVDACRSVRVATGAVSLAGPAFRMAFVLDC